jgi:hypothetical protein
MIFVSDELEVANAVTLTSPAPGKVRIADAAGPVNVKAQRCVAESSQAVVCEALVPTDLFVRLLLGGGNDTLTVQNGVGIEVSAEGSTGDDVLTGGERNDGLAGGAGNDLLHGMDGRDGIYGQAGDDQCFAGDDFKGDICGGGPGADRCVMGPGNDRCFGKTGADVCLGEAGRDVCNGGKGPERDLCIGGPGFDSAIDCERAPRSELLRP